MKLENFKEAARLVARIEGLKDKIETLRTRQITLIIKDRRDHDELDFIDTDDDSDHDFADLGRSLLNMIIGRLEDKLVSLIRQLEAL
jgi:hypothetical protein